MSRRPWGMGSLFQRKDGRWVGRTPDGRYATGRDKDEVKVRLRNLLRSTSSRRVTNRTVESAVTAWLGAIASTRADRTVAGYRTIAERYILPELGPVPLDKLTIADVEAWRDGLLRRRSAQTVTHYLAALRTALTFALKRGWVERNVASLVDGPSIRRQDRKPWSEAEVDQFLAHVQGDRLHALYVLAALTGMRQGELLGLRWQDVDLEGRQLTVNRTLQRLHGKYQSKVPKTPRSRRTISLPTRAVEALRAHQRAQLAERTEPGRVEQGLVFTRPLGSPLDASQLWREFQAHIEAAGLRRVTFHSFRHGAATIMHNHGIPLRVIADQLGHSTPSVTANLYAWSAEDAQQRTADLMDRLFGGGKGAN